MDLRRGLLWFHTAIQLLFGVLGFALAPGELFSEVPANPLAGLCLRLAACSNASQAALVVGLLLYSREVALSRLIAGALAIYHVLACIDGVRVAAGWLPIAIAAGKPPPLGMHLVLAVALGLAAAWPAPRKVEAPR